jgi:hypothetical protein
MLLENKKKNTFVRLHIPSCLKKLTERVFFLKKLLSFYIFFHLMNVDGHPRRSRPKKRWMDCVKDDMRIKRVSMEMTSDRREWKKKTCCVDPT